MVAVFTFLSTFTCCDHDLEVNICILDWCDDYHEYEGSICSPQFEDHDLAVLMMWSIRCMLMLGQGTVYMFGCDEYHCRMAPTYMNISSNAC